MSSSTMPSMQELLEKERVIINKIKMGDFEDPELALDDILKDIFTLEGQNMGVIKVKVLELMLLLSRAVVDGGADYARISKINHWFISKIAYLKTLEAVSRVAHQALQAYIDRRPTRSGMVEDAVLSVKQFIRKNYSRQITLEEIARSVHLSPCYLSHLFKDNEGITVMDYLTKVRIEQAKILLLNPNYSIYEVSEKLGYKEPGYFAKVFRRREGRTPSQFRKLG